MFDIEQLNGKTVVITGASSGIGRATAKLLGDLGANLVLGARRINHLNDLAGEINSEVLTLPLDVTQEDSVQLFVDQAIEKFGKIDALINSAGTGMFASVLDLSVEEFEKMIDVNVKGTFLCCKYVGQHMVSQHHGKILNMVSIAGTTALAGCGGYSASKFGVLGLTRVLQTELRDKGVQVTAVLPGAINTSFWDSIQPMPDTSLMIPAEVLAQHLIYLLCQPEGAVIDELTVLPPLGIL